MTLTGGPFFDFTTQTAQSALQGASASSAPFWGDQPDSWDAVYLAGVRIPGLCTVGGKGFEQRVDKKKTAGKHGAKITRTGNECADIDITVRMWTQEHLTAFEQLLKAVKPRKEVRATTTKTLPAGNRWEAYADQMVYDGASPAYRRLRESQAPAQATKTSTKVIEKAVGGAVPIYHPALALFGISKVVVLSATLPEPSSQGEFQSRLKCIEYVEEGKSKSKVETVKSSAADPRIMGLGPGAGGRRIAAQSTPADDNTGP